MNFRISPFADSSPVPVAEELEGEAGWNEWSRAVQQQDAWFAPTVPAALEPAPAPARARPAAEITLDDVLQETRRNHRVCPRPVKWQSLYALLAAKAGTAPLPPAPLAGVVWDRTPVMPKRMGFLEHLEWAAARGCLPAVLTFLKSMHEDDWHHFR